MSDAKKPYGNKGRIFELAGVTRPQNSVAGGENKVAGAKNGVAGPKVRVAALCCLTVLFAIPRAPIAAEGELCRRAVIDAATRTGVPHSLLLAVALVESGRRDRGSVSPWPWSLNVDGQGYFFERPADAAEAARYYVRAGASNVDVGCLQVSLRWWHGAFSHLEDALAPERNALIAARLLADFRRRHGSWTAAVAAYHGGSAARRKDYVCRVYRHLVRLAAASSPSHGECVRGDEQ